MEMIIPFFPHAYLIELVQLVCAIIGFFASVGGTRDSQSDISFVLKSGHNGRRLFIAQQNLFEEIARLVVHTLFIVSGVVSVLLAPPAPGFDISDQRYMQLYVTRVVMTLASIIMTYKSIRDIQFRRRLRELMEMHHD